MMEERFNLTTKDVIRIYYRAYVRALRNTVPHTEEEIIQMINENDL